MASIGRATLCCWITAFCLVLLQWNWSTEATDFSIAVNRVSGMMPGHACSRHGQNCNGPVRSVEISIGSSGAPRWRAKSVAARCRRCAMRFASVPKDLLNAQEWDLFSREAGLSVGGPPQAVLPSREQPDFAAMQQEMRHDGYSKMQRAEWDTMPEYVPRLEALDAGISLLEAAGLPEQFLLMFDEAWDVVNSVSHALEPIYGLKNNMDFFVFNVRPGKTGWNLHRDRPEGKVGLAADRMPEYTTVWIALTDASPETSCIYVLPAHADPEYDTMSGSKYDSQVVAFALQHVRALPVKSGTVLTWSHRVLHWGSAAPAGATSARRTLTFAMASPGYEQPLLNVEAGQRPPFEARLALIAYTLICYHHSQPVPPSIQPVLVEIIRQHSGHLTLAAIVQQTGESLLKNLLAFEPELHHAVEAAGDRLLSQFGLKTDWWHAECVARAPTAQSR